LQGYLDRWAAETDHGERKGPFDKQPGEMYGVALTGADVSWLVERSGFSGLTGVPNLHLEGADISRAHLEGALLSHAHLEGATSFRAHLEESNLSSARLEEAKLFEAHLERANLRNAYLEKAILSYANLEGTDLLNAWMDKATALNSAKLDRAFLDQLSFDGVNLAVVKRDSVKTLGEEVRAHTSKDDNGKRKDQRTRLDDYEAAVRAHLQLAAAMRSQGMGDQADRFSYRAQVLQRGVLRYRRRFGAALGSWFLDRISGYGYRPMRAIITYLLVVGAFALTYYLLGNNVNPPLDPLGSVVFSITSFHGRGFAPGENVLPNNPVTVIAAIEAIVGLLIEITFIATFTQRFFAR
jgi:hypothetical protein